MVEELLDKFTLRPVREADLGMLLEWRNQESVRKFMYTNHIISIDEHRKWYEKNKNQDSTKLMLFEFNETPFAFLNISEINQKNKTCTWAFYIGQDIKEVKALGYFMEIKALDLMIKELGIRKISCEVLDFNKSVIKMHKRFGFQEEGILKKHIYLNEDYIDIHKLAIFDNTWNNTKKVILNDLSKMLSG